MAKVMNTHSFLLATLCVYKSWLDLYGRCRLVQVESRENTQSSKALVIQGYHENGHSNENAHRIKDKFNGRFISRAYDRTSFFL